MTENIQGVLDLFKSNMEPFIDVMKSTGSAGWELLVSTCITSSLVNIIIWLLMVYIAVKGLHFYYDIVKAVGFENISFVETIILMIALLFLATAICGLPFISEIIVNLIHPEYCAIQEILQTAR